MIAFDKNSIPFITVIIDPTGDHPVILTAKDDWSRTGEYILSVTPLEALRLANQVLQFAANSMADEVWEQLEIRRRMGERFGDEESMSP